MSEIVNTFLLAWDKFITQMHLRQPGFTNCGPFNKTKKEYKNLKNQDD